MSDKRPGVRNSGLKSMQDYLVLAIASQRGGEEYIRTYMEKHLRETEPHYRKRLKKAFYINIVGKITGILASFIVKNVTRTVAIDDDTMAKQYLNKIDYYQTAKKFFEKKIKEFLLTGNALVIADAFPDERAFLHDVSMLNVMDYSNSGRGLNSVDVWINDTVVRYQDDVIRTATIKGYNSEPPSFGAETPNQIGQIPIVTVSPLHAAYEPFFRDAVYVGRAIFEHMNNISMQLWETGFTILAGPPMGIDGKTTKKKEYDPDTTRYIELIGPIPVKPEFIGPPTEHLDLYIKFVTTLIDWLFTILNIYRDRSSSAESGLSKSYDYSIMVSMLEDVAETFQQFENDCWDMLGLYDSRIADNRDNIVVSYSKKFDVEAIKDQLEEVARLLSLEISPTFDGYMMKKIVGQFVENDDVKEIINQEIDGQDHKPLVIPDKTKTGGSPAPAGNTVEVVELK